MEPRATMYDAGSDRPRGGSGTSSGTTTGTDATATAEAVTRAMTRTTVGTATGTTGTAGTTTGTAAEAVDPRESMRRLPGWMQQPLTVFTGRPYSGQQPLPWWSRTYHIVIAALSLVAGVAVSTIGWAAGGWWLLLLAPGWAVTLHGLRNLRMLVFHQCAHANLYRRPRLDTVVGEFLASVIIVQNFQRYRREHVSDHHAAHHMTLRDPTVQAFLIGLDIHPGMPVRTMWRHVLTRIASPVFHTRFFVGRVQSFWRASSTREKVFGAVLYGGGTALAVVTGNTVGLAVVWGVPLIVLFQISNTLRLCVKHTFPAPGTAHKRGKAYFGSLTHAIFIGEAAPPAGLGRAEAVRQWTRWTLRMVFVHAPIRYLVITGDTPVHDHHHRHPATPQWAHHLYERQRDLDEGHPGWPPYTELWGLTDAINTTFATISAASPAEYDVKDIPAISNRQLFTTFDD